MGLVSAADCPGVLCVIRLEYHVGIAERPYLELSDLKDCAILPKGPGMTQCVGLVAHSQNQPTFFTAFVAEADRHRPVAHIASEKPG